MIKRPTVVFRHTPFPLFPQGYYRPFLPPANNIPQDVGLRFFLSFLRVGTLGFVPCPSATLQHYFNCCVIVFYLTVEGWATLEFYKGANYKLVTVCFEATAAYLSLVIIRRTIRSNAVEALVCCLLHNTQSKAKVKREIRLTFRASMAVTVAVGLLGAMVHVFKGEVKTRTPM